MRKYFTYALGLLLLAFAGLTFFLSTSVIFDLFDVRASQGNYVLFIVITNLVCSLLYFSAVYGIFTQKRFAIYALLTALSILILSFAYLNIYINNGGIYEEKTYGAMMFRMAVTAFFCLASYILIPKKQGLVYE